MPTIAETYKTQIPSHHKHIVNVVPLYKGARLYWSGDEVASCESVFRLLRIVSSRNASSMKALACQDICVAASLGHQEPGSYALVSLQVSALRLVACGTQGSSHCLIARPRTLLESCRTTGMGLRHLVNRDEEATQTRRPAEYYHVS